MLPAVALKEQSDPALQYLTMMFCARSRHLGIIDKVLIRRGGGCVPIPARVSYHAGKYPWHCRMLEHEDNEMILQFEVMP